MQRLLYGAHMSIAGGLDKAISRGESIGCTTIQLFTKSSRQWTCNPLSTEEIELYKTTVAQSAIDPVVAHTAYLINIGSPTKDIENKSIQSLITELERCNQLSIPYLVLHPGAHLETDEQSCLDRIVDNLNGIFLDNPGDTMILLELMPGQGSTVCYTFEQLAYVLKHVRTKKRLGVCLDTAHAWAAGYDFSTEKKYEIMWKQFEDTLGLESLKAIHMNDSKNRLGSHVDRHETIGKGTIGIQAFEMLMNDERFFDVPKILETPKETLDDDVYNMKTLKDLLTPSSYKKLNNANSTVD